VTIGTGECSTNASIVFIAAGHVSIGPTGVVAQSNAAIRVANSPSPARKGSLPVLGTAFLVFRSRSVATIFDAFAQRMAPNAPAAL
jgi:hypothetical protein